MPPRLAAILCFIGIFGLFYLDRSKDERDRTSWALWLPIVWLTFAGSRMLSQWLALSSGISFSTPDAYLEGSPVDRLIFTAMVAVSLLILVARRQRTAAVLRQNLPLIAFFAYLPGQRGLVRLPVRLVQTLDEGRRQFDDDPHRPHGSQSEGGDQAVRQLGRVRADSAVRAAR